MHFKITGGNDGAVITTSNQTEKGGVLYVEVKMTLPKSDYPKKFSIHWDFPIHDCYSVWSPSIKTGRQLGPNWGKRTTNSRLAAWMPLHTILSATGKNRMAIAISDAITPCAIATGVCEETAELECRIDFFTNLVSPLKEYSATIRIDTRGVAYYDAIYDIAEWWEKECGYKPAHVPEYARLPMNSLWYSYHQQLNPNDIIEECKLSKQLGMETVIVDDGWQTDDNSRGYAFCGDWNVAKSKIPDMKKFVEEVHSTGMKIMIWYSVPFMGENAKNYERFKNMLLTDCGGHGFHALDPRYKEVREFLIGLYSNAVKEWKLDGLKLDFIDAFALKGKSAEFDSKRDTQSLEEATDRLMTEITRSLTAINPDILIEFRQAYIGPAIRKYGNMLRVADCPNDAVMNRIDVVNLRLTSGKTAVHSDMIMWNSGEPVESAAQQFASILYSVPQISVKLKTLPEDHKKMLKYYLSFWIENKELLLDGKILAANPESCYSLVCSEKNGKAIFTAYTDSVIDSEKYNEIVAVNCTRFNSLIIKNAVGKNYKTVNCMGEELNNGKIDSELFEINVPLSGMIFIK